VVIHENDPEHFEAFVILNEHWISQIFELEEAKRELAKSPARIVDQQGYIFSAVSNADIAGVCALFYHGDNQYELARMAVTPLYQKQGIGSALIEHAIKKLQDLRAKKVILHTNTRLEPALSLYRRYGFSTTKIGPHPHYSRCDIIMEREISADKTQH